MMLPTCSHGSCQRANGLDQELTYYERYLEWASAGREQPVAEAALAWLQKHKPSGEPEGLVWGDARIGNIIFDGTKPAAVIDWEMVTCGSPEKDLAWTVFLDVGGGKKRQQVAENMNALHEVMRERGYVFSDFELGDRRCATPRDAQLANGMGMFADRCQRVHCE